MYTLKEIAEWSTNTAWLFAGQLFLVFLVLILLDILFGNRVRSSIRYGIWCLIIFKAIFPVQFALPTGISWWVQIPQAGEVFHRPDDKISGSAFQTNTSSEALKSNWDTSNKKTPQTENASGANGMDDEMVIRLSMKSVFFLIYLMGVLGFTLYYLDRYRLLKRNDRESHSAPIEIQNVVDRLSAEIGLKTKVEVRISSYSSSPSVKGFFRPVIFIPSVLLDRLEKSSFELILLHELYHVKRGDLWMNYLQAMVHVLHFYNPVIWLANYQILKYREIATDEAVLTHQHINVKDYSHTLLNTAELTIASPVPQTFALCVAETKSKLQERIESILKRPRAKSSQLGWSGWLVITVLGFVLLPMSSARLVAGSIGDNEHFAQSNDLSVVEKIDSKVEEIFEASNAADLEAYLAHFSEEASELHPGIEGIYGKDAVRRSMLNREMGRVQFFDAEYGDRIIWDCGGWVIEVGNIDFEFSFRNNPERLIESRQFLTLWSYDDGEDLKVRLLSWNKRIDPKLANHHEDPVVLNLNSDFSGELSAFENHPEIEALEDAYHRTLVEQDYDETLTFVSDDITYVPMNRGIIFGLKQFEKMIKESGIPLQEIKRESAKIWGNDDMLVVLNIFNWVLEEPQNSRDSFLGKGVHIWKKMPDGQWKLFLDTNNLNTK